MVSKISRSQFVSRLKERKLENVSVVDLVEKSLMRERGFVFRMPKKGTPVVLLLSGGLDSITSWGILMREFGLPVYPISVDKGEKKVKKEKAVIDYFSSYYRTRFPSLYHRPLWLPLGSGDISIPVEQAVARIHPEMLMRKMNAQAEITGLNVSLGSFLLLPVYARLYAEYLNYTQNLNMHALFCSVTIGDGLVVPHQTFTALRSMMYYLCATTGDFRWQFTSLIFEKEIGLYWDKSDLVKWAYNHALPIERTWTCSHAAKYQCGGPDCIGCVGRRNAFAQAHVPDKTIYRPLKQQSAIGFLKFNLRRLLHTLRLQRKNFR